MKHVTLAVNVILRIPQSWDYFWFQGWLYRKDSFGKWVLDRNIAA